MKKIISMLLLIALTLAMAGCVAAVVAVGAGAAGTVAYIRGDFEAIKKESIEQLYDATLKALESLKIPVFSKGQDALTAIIEGRTAEDKKIVIKIEAQENNLSKLSIRIGTFGDQTQSGLIYKKINEFL
ncbi:DUF3568 family protein [Planctomycetota bacterium]